MRDLLCIGRTTVDPTLKSLSNLRIERFLHVKVQDRIGDPERDGAKQTSQRIRLLQILKQKRCVGHASNETLEVTLRTEDVDRQAHVQDGLTRDQVFGHFGKDEPKHSLLVLYFLGVYEGYASKFIVMLPILAPNGVTLITLKMD